MKTILITKALEMLFAMFDAAEVRELLDDLIDRIENRRAGSSDPKDVAIFAACQALRTVLQIPDDIGGDDD